MAKYFGSKIKKGEIKILQRTSIEIPHLKIKNEKQDRRITRY